MKQIIKDEGKGMIKGKENEKGIEKEQHKETIKGTQGVMFIPTIGETLCSSHSLCKGEMNIMKCCHNTCCHDTFSTC